MRRFRSNTATSSSTELEWVFFSATPSSGSRSRIAPGLTSSSRASSLIRIFFIATDGLSDASMFGNTRKPTFSPLQSLRLVNFRKILCEEDLIFQSYQILIRSKPRLRPAAVRQLLPPRAPHQRAAARAPSPQRALPARQLPLHWALHWTRHWTRPLPIRRPVRRGLPRARARRSC